MQRSRLSEQSKRLHKYIFIPLQNKAVRDAKNSMMSAQWASYAAPKHSVCYILLRCHLAGCELWCQ